jgi:sulfite reductase (NADPH) flavoprotein alpha-component
MKKITILYGTETGNAELLALDAGKHAEEQGFEADVRGMEQISIEELTGVRRLLIFCSTWGDGEQPDNAQDLFDAVSACDGGTFSGLNYGVLALGDTAFDLFCESGKEWDAVLHEKGAHRLIERMDCDTDYDDDALYWTENSISEMKTIE